MIAIKLGSDFHQCPSWWKKFVEEVHGEHRQSNDEETAIIRINDALKQYSARTEYVQNIAYVYFDDDAKHTWFVLQWS